ncbi:MAG: hypothetical protein R3195_02200 [Gemmatimonadota bacterium]|nr:hypothetical protein [Gemmatimonadota bacterium]
MPEDRPDEDLLLSEPQVREIIERAARREPGADGVTVAELRQIARELEIDEPALNNALEEVLGQTPPTPAAGSWFRRQVARLGGLLDDILPRRGRLLSGVALGAALGWSSAAFSPGSEMDVPVGLAMVLLTVANSLSRRLYGRFERFVAETVGMWSAFAAFWSVTYGGPTGDLATWVGINLVAATIWGWFVVRRSRDDRLLPSGPETLRGFVESSPDEESSVRRDLTLLSALLASRVRPQTS